MCYVTSPSTTPFSSCLSSQCILAVGSGLAGKVVSFFPFPLWALCLLFRVVLPFVWASTRLTTVYHIFWDFISLVVVVRLSCSPVSRFLRPVFSNDFAPFSSLVLCEPLFYHEDSISHLFNKHSKLRVLRCRPVRSLISCFFYYPFIFLFFSPILVPCCGGDRMGYVFC